VIETEDLTIIWDSEITMPEWEEIAKAEYINLHKEPDGDLRACLGLCTKGFCTRFRNHKGPHLSVRNIIEAGGPWGKYKSILIVEGLT
jgi:hypothetical protein